MGKENTEIIQERVQVDSNRKLLPRNHKCHLILFSGWKRKYGGQVINEILAQVHLTVEPIVISTLSKFIIGIDKLRRWKALSHVP